MARYNQLTPLPFKGLTHLLCSADDSFEYKMDKLAMVNSSGVVVWTPHGRLRSYCNLDLSMFPFDSHHCVLQFGPWSYDRSLVSIGLNPATRSHHRKYLEASTISVSLSSLLGRVALVAQRGL